MRTIELCAGAGGQALGLHNAGFHHSALVEIDSFACSTLRHNNRIHKLGWGEIYEEDLKQFVTDRAESFRGEIDLVAGGVPCPPFSKAGMQLGHLDDRDLFPIALKCVEKVEPLAVLLENVPGLVEKKFQSYRNEITSQLNKLGYACEWRVLQASDFGVPQLRPRAILIAFKEPFFSLYKWPTPLTTPAPTVGDVLFDLVNSNGWEGAQKWRMQANRIAPTLVGGSKKHGGPDLGPSRAKKQWQSLAVNAHRLGGEHEIPGKNFKGALLRTGEIRAGYDSMPLLTVRMAARIQGFPDFWEFVGSKTHSYRQVGNAFPPPVAEALGLSISSVIQQIKRDRE